MTSNSRMMLSQAMKSRLRAAASGKFLATSLILRMATRISKRKSSPYRLDMDEVSGNPSFHKGSQGII